MHRLMVGRHEHEFATHTLERVLFGGVGGLCNKRHGASAVGAGWIFVSHQPSTPQTRARPLKGLRRHGCPVIAVVPFGLQGQPVSAGPVPRGRAKLRNRCPASGLPSGCLEVHWRISDASICTSDCARRLRFCRGCPTDRASVDCRRFEEGHRHDRPKVASAERSGDSTRPLRPAEHDDGRGSGCQPPGANTARYAGCTGRFGQDDFGAER